MSKYIARTDKRTYMRLTEGLGTVQRFVGVVEFTKRGAEPETAAETRAYERESMAKMQATRLAKQYQTYFDREGERWEVLQRQKREAQAERNRIAAVHKRLVRDFSSLDAAEQQDALAALRAICPEA